MKPTIEDVVKNVDVMSHIIPFFPSNELSKLLLAQIIHKFVNTADELSWLVVTACNNMRDWDRSGGVVELRGIFCTKFSPADGIQTHSTSAGFSSEDCEARALELEIKENERRFQEYQQQALNAPEEDRQPFPLPELKRIPGPPKKIVQ